MISDFTDKNNQVYQYQYDLIGNLINEKNPLGKVTEYIYDPLNRLEEKIDAVGARTRYNYDELGNLIQLTDAEGGVWRYQFDAIGRTISAIDPLSRTTGYEYDENGNTIHTVDPAGNLSSYQYDANNRLVEQIDAEGAKWRFNYNAIGQLIEKIDPYEESYSYTYDPEGNLLEDKNPLESTYQYQYDKVGRLSKTIDPAGFETNLFYDLVGNLKKKVDALGYETSFTYDELNRLIEVETPEGNKTEYEYDPVGNKTKVVDPLKRETTYEYDPINQLRTVIDAIGGTTKYQYDGVGNLTSYIDANNNQRTMEYNLNHQVTTMRDPLNNQFQYRYDAAGQLAQVQDANGQNINYSYTPTGQVASAQYTDWSTQFNYDRVGRVIEMEAPDSKDQFTYDLLGRVVQQQNLNTNKGLSFQYDVVGNLTSFTNSEDRTVAYSYDNRNLLVEMVDPDENVTTFDYDGLGREINRSMANGNKITKSYYPDGNLDTITNQGKENIISSFTYEYDDYGNRIRQIEEDGAESTYTYDDLNRLIEVTYPKEKILTYRQTPNTPQDEIKNGQEESLKEKGQQENSADEKGNNGKEKSNTNKFSLKDKVLISSLSFGIDNLVLFTLNIGKGNTKEDKPSNSDSNNTSNGNSNSNLDTEAKEKSNNGKGNKSDTVNGVDSAEEELLFLNDRPEYLIEPQSKVQYTYDAVGNRLSMTNDQGTVHYSYNNANQLIEADNKTYSYDANGNLIKEIEDGQEKEYRYNGANRLVEVLFFDESYAKYQYDALGRKSFREAATWDYNEDPEGKTKEKTNNGKGDEQKNDKAKENSASKGKSKTNNNRALDNPGQGNKYGVYKNREDLGKLEITKTSYQYEGLSNILHKEYGENGQPYAEFYTGPNNQVVAQKMFGMHGLAEPGQDPELKTTGGLMYYQYDGLNTVSEITDRHGDIIERYRYDAFGGIFTGITSPYNRVGFTGQEYDDKTGLIDMNARMYNPIVGQFTTADTYFGDVTNPLTLNRYAYVLNNPVNMWDPSGNIPEWVGNEYHFDIEDYSDIHTAVTWDWTLIGQGREEGEERQVDKYKDANYFYLVYEQDVYKWWTYNVKETTYEYDINDPDWQEWILMGKGGRVTDNSNHTFEEYSIEGFEVPITPEEMALISKGIIDSYGPPPGDRRMLYSIKQGFLDGESISQDVIIYGEGGKETRYNIYEREIKEVIGEPQIISQVNKSNPTFWSATGNFFGGIGGSVVDTVTGIGNMVFHPIQTAQGIGNALAHPIDTSKAIWDTVSTSFVNDVINGDANTRARFAGRAIGEIGLAVVGTKGLDKVSKIDKVVDATRAVKATLGRVSDDAARILGNEGGYIRLGRAVEGTGNGLDGVRIINKKYAGEVFELSGDLAKKYPDGVKFTKEGFPDFSSYSKKTVTVDGLQGDAYYDFIKANQAAGYKTTPKGYTWHHVEDGTTMMLVPSDLHGTVRHTGGASLIRNGIRP